MKRLLLALGVVALSAAANALTPRRAAAEGSWEYVCCGSGCEIGDVCAGTGNYICCKEE